MNGRVNAVQHAQKLREFFNELQADWEKESDPAALLAAFNSYNEMNLLRLAANQTACNDATSALNQCLSLLAALAKHKNTNVYDLIKLLTEVGGSTQSNAWSYIHKNHPKAYTQYVQIVLRIAERDDLSAADIRELRKLLTYHDQRGQERGKEKDGSIVFDLARHELDVGSRGILKEYLNMILKLAEAGTIDSDVIYNALRTPLGESINIGSLIAETYEYPDCFLLFTKLCDHLAPTQVDQLFPSGYVRFRNYQIKERICDAIENLKTPEEIITMCALARDSNTALGRLMHLKRDVNEVSETRGAYLRLKNIYQKALLAREEKHLKHAQNIKNAPLPIAPPLDEPEFMQLFVNADKKDYEKYVKRTSQKFHFKNTEEAQRALRYAAAYGNQDDVLIILNDHRVDVNYHNDIGDKCADATALYLAVEQEDIENVRILLDHKADPNIARRLGITPFCRAAINGNVEIAKLLLENGAQVNVLSRYKNSPLYFAATKGNHAIINLMVDHYRLHADKNINELVEFLQKDQQLLRSIEEAADGETLLALAKLTDLLAEKGVAQETLDAMIPQSYSFKNRKIKESLLEAIKKKPRQEKVDLCFKIINHELGMLHKVVMLKRGGLLAKPARRGAGILGKLQHIHKVAVEFEAVKEYNAIASKYKQCEDHLNHQERQHLEEVLQNDEHRVIVSNEHGFLLFCAIARNDIETIKLLLKYGADTRVRRSTHIDVLKGVFSCMKIDMKNYHDYVSNLGGNKAAKINPEELAELFGHQEAAKLLHEQTVKLNSLPVTAVAVAAALPVEPSATNNNKLAATPDVAPPSYDAVIAAQQTEAEQLVVVAPKQEETKVVEEAKPVVAAEVAEEKPTVLTEPQKQTQPEPKEAVAEQVALPANSTQKLYPEVIRDEAHDATIFPLETRQYIERAQLHRAGQAALPVVNPLPAPTIDVLVNPLTGEALPVTTTPAVTSDPFATIDAILSAPAAEKKPVWIAGLDEIDFSESSSSTAAIMSKMGDLITFTEQPVAPVEPVKPIKTPFDDWLVETAQAEEINEHYINPFENVDEEKQREEKIAAELKALPPAPTGSVSLFFPPQAKIVEPVIVESKRVAVEATK